MDIMGVQNRANTYEANKVKEDTKRTDAKTSEQKAETVPVKKDEFVSSESAEQITYKKPSGNVSANQLMEMERQRSQSFQNMIQGMVAKQGQASNLTMFGMKLNVTQEQSATAAASIADGGEHSVDAVAGRIMDMAKALSGGDESKLESLRTAVQKGFKAAGVDFGGKMPDITNKTYTEVMKRFDDWKQEGASKRTGATTAAD